MTFRSSPCWGLLLPTLWLAWGNFAVARTITITAEASDRIACISASVPRMSWAPIQHGPGIFDTAQQLQFRPGMALLIRFPLDTLPVGQRIVKAELSLHVQYAGGTSRLQVRRLLAEWGLGVCHQYRRTHPDKVEWSQPGGRGAGTDRAARDSALFVLKEVGDYSVDVTEDVELWYTGGAANRGWILTGENEQATVYLASPYSPNTGHAKQWKLQITFEPE